MILTNYQMEEMLGAITPEVLDRADLIGYAAARNTRILRGACAEYLDMRERLVCELGEPETDDEGNQTGTMRLDFASPRFAEFAEAMEAVAPVESEVELFRIPVGEAIGKLSGTQLLALDWMFEED